MQLISFLPLFLTSILAANLPTITSTIPVDLTRVNGERVTLGPGPGCFGTFGSFKNIKVGSRGIVVFYSDYNCKGSIIGDYLEGDAQILDQLSPLSIEILDAEDESCGTL